MPRRAGSSSGRAGHLTEPEPASNGYNAAAVRAGGDGTLDSAAATGDAIERARTDASRDPEDPKRWRELGDVLADDGRLAEAAAAFRQAVELRPADAAARIDLAHCAYASGQEAEALAQLEQVVERDPGNLNALRSLVDMHRRGGRLPAALLNATKLVEAGPDDVLATIDVGELNMSLGHLQAAGAAFRRLLEVDSEPGHEVYAYHAMIQVELAGGQWRRALDVAIDATRVDRYGRTTDVLAYIVGQVFGDSDRPAPSLPETEAALLASQAEHRRLHIEELVL